jgi:hypothetical protein
MPQKKTSFTKRELKLIDIACWQLIQVLDMNRETWTGKKNLQARNQQDLKTLAEIRSKIKTGE